MTETLLRTGADRATDGQPPGPIARRAKIVCTIGPATSAPERLAALVAAGMDIARLNFSHGDQEAHAAAYAKVRADGTVELRVAAVGTGPGDSGGPPAKAWPAKRWTASSSGAARSGTTAA